MAQADTTSSFWSEVFAASLYKPNSGRVVRQVTAVAIAIVALFGAWKLHLFLNTNYEVAPAVSLGSGCLLAVVSIWMAFRLVNWPRFAEFLIDVEIEMSKVSWANWDYLVRATVVVIAVMFVTGAALFVYDVFWQWLFKAIGFINMGESAS